jgi:4-hydroxy-tetrahydrodipicolinate reductase
MGRTVVRALAERADMRLVGALASSTSSLVGRDAGENAGVAALGVAIQPERRAVLERADVAIDFSLPVAVAANVAACVERRCPMVVGTTGLNDSALNGLRLASNTIALLYSPNMSVAVNLMFRMADTTPRSWTSITATRSMRRRAPRCDWVKQSPGRAASISVRARC